MGFIDKITTTITGKTAEQRQSDSLARSIASRQIQKAAFEERARQMERVAIKREQLRADAMIRKEQQRFAPKPKVSYSSPVGGPSLMGSGLFSGGGSLFDGKRNKLTKAQRRYKVI